MALSEKTAITLGFALSIVGPGVGMAYWVAGVDARQVGDHAELGHVREQQAELMKSMVGLIKDQAAAISDIRSSAASTQAKVELLLRRTESRR